MILKNYKHFLPIFYKMGEDIMSNLEKQVDLADRKIGVMFLSSVIKKAGYVCVSFGQKCFSTCPRVCSIGMGK